MTIVSNFAFAHSLTAPPVDLLGPLHDLVGPNGRRTWRGTGFNQIWRPNNGAVDHFLQLMFTTEELFFLDITGNGIANRGLLQPDIFLGGLSYLQQIQDSFDESGQHFESGNWLNVPATINPLEVTTLTRQGAIPHGALPQMQGVSLSVPQPHFQPVSITPFPIGNPGNPITFTDQDLSQPSTSRTDLSRVAALDQAHLDNLNLFLSDAIANETVIETTVLHVATDATALATLVGGGVSNIAFLAGLGTPPAGGPNALAAFVEATFWIEHIKGGDGKDNFHQLQYSQKVHLVFNGLVWPHVTVATLKHE